MHFLINPNVVYLLTVAAVLLFPWASSVRTSKLPMLAMSLCLVAAGYELVYLKGNPWALLVVALSPLPFFVAVRQTRPVFPLLIIAVLMLTVGAAFLFVDQNGHPAVNYGLAGIVSALAAQVIWISVGRKQNEPGTRISDDPDSVVGLIGEARTEIESHSTGSVEVEGELWTARSEMPIAAGNVVRVLRRDGFVLTVKKEEGMMRA